jgi:hypothetical protein
MPVVQLVPERIRVFVIFLSTKKPLVAARGRLIRVFGFCGAAVAAGLPFPLDF